MNGIRPVAAGDVPAVVALVTQVLAEFGLEFGSGSATDDELRELPGSYQERGGAFWVATRDGALVGTCGVFPLAAGTFEVRKMYLLPAARGLGLGARLLDAAVAWARDHGAHRLVLDTTEQMTRAIAFYEAHGFVRDDAQRRGARCSRGYVRDLAAG
ncbi:MAG: GNAT family N-acetyltransferase [Kofleriaceae bacterium]|nr:GNAT family N-acetyltransferase [Kofleriaceae bacterium]MCL4225110.1 GNAT family N-acetyltransferase [Myxococcales bacterium]